HVEAARTVGAGDGYILRREILPNVMPSVFVLAVLNIATVIIMEASLSFLGLGVQPPTPTWGGMIAAGRNYLLEQWWLSALPGAAIMALVLSVNLFGEGLREALDPRLRE
ncbi:MAG: ABC transporter permease, partial [Planctomycetes bacterium]|nr:ABC transporter permease [Planctomycetota bacterium]